MFFSISTGKSLPFNSPPFNKGRGNRDRIQAKLHQYLLASLLFFLVLSTKVSAQTVIKHTNADLPLKERWSWAIKEAENQGWNQSYWIGYSFVKAMWQLEKV
jgi:hypothetical protein